MSNDDVFARWQERFDRIHTELTFLFSNRRKFLDLMDMFENNEQLYAIGSQPYLWIVGHWGRDAAMAIRRELDTDRNSVSFGALLEEMTERNNVLTRRRYLAFLKSADRDIIDINNRQFEKWGIVSRTEDPGDDYLTSDGIKADITTLMTAAQPVMKYANRVIAHRNPINTINLTVRDIHAAFEAMENASKSTSSSSLVVLSQRLNPLMSERIGNKSSHFPGMFLGKDENNDRRPCRPR